MNIVYDGSSLLDKNKIEIKTPTILKTMTREQGIEWIRKIQSGSFDRNEIDIPKGGIAFYKWDETDFEYGMEYGAILAIMKIFDIKKEEL